MRVHLSAETWRQLDPYAGQLPRRQSQLLWLVGSSALVALLLGILGVHIGMLVPRLEPGGSTAYFYDPARPVFGYGFEIVNSGQFSIDVTGVGRDAPGLALILPPPEVESAERGRAAGPGRLAPGERMWLAVGYEVTDCAAVPSEPWPIPVRVARPWGTSTYWFQPRQQGPGEFSAELGDMTPSVEWQRNLADAVC